MSELYKRIKKANSQNRPTRESIAQSLRETTTKTSGLRFDLSSETEDKPVNLRMNQRAVIAVADFLTEFALPFKPKLSYVGSVRNATKNGDLSDGIVKVGALIRTAMGNKINIEFPVNIRNGSVLRPAVFFWNDSPYVACQAAFDLLVKNGTLQKEVKHRRMYQSPSMETSPEPRRPIYNLEHMFSPGARNPLTFQKQHSKEAAGFGVAPMSGHNPPRRAPKFLHQLPQRETPSVVDVDMDSDEPTKPLIVHPHAPPKAPVGPTRPLDQKPFAVGPDQYRGAPKAAPGSAKRPYLWSGTPEQEVRKLTLGQKEPEDRKRVNIDEEVAMTNPHQNEVPEEMLDIAERDRDGLHEIGDHVKLTHDYQVRERGGSFLTLPKGEEGYVVRDMHGDGKQLYVEFEDLGLAAVIQNNFLKSAAVTERQVENEMREMAKIGYTKVDIVDAVRRLYPDYAYLADKLLEK